MVDAARLADELRAEQDHAAAQASAKQSLSNELAQLEGRLSLKPLLLEVARLPWPSWRARSVTLRPSLPTHRHALGSLLRLISVLNESARSSSSLLVRTRRTRIACPTLLLSSSLRSRLTSSRLK